MWSSSPSVFWEEIKDGIKEGSDLCTRVGRDIKYPKVYKSSNREEEEEANFSFFILVIRWKVLTYSTMLLVRNKKKRNNLPPGGRGSFKFCAAQSANLVLYWLEFDLKSIERAFQRVLISNNSPKKRGGISGKSCLGIPIFNRKDLRELPAF